MKAKVFTVKGDCPFCQNKDNNQRLKKLLANVWAMFCDCGAIVTFQQDAAVSELVAKRYINRGKKENKPNAGTPENGA